MKVGVYIDSLLFKGGLERTVLKMGRWFDADIITSGYEAKGFDGWDKPRVIDLGNTTERIKKAAGFRYLGFDSVFRAGYVEAALRFQASRGRWDYDVNIFNGCYSLFAAVKGELNIFYCSSPNRTLYDRRDEIYGSLNPLEKPLWNAYSAYFKPRDQAIVKECMTAVVVNSKTVQERVKRYYGIDAQIIYAPISTARYRFIEFGDFFVMASRLVPEKRVDLVIEAFNKLADKKLVVVGDGPHMPFLRRLAGGNPNVRFLGTVDENVLAELYGRCLATVFMPKKEDLGMVPLEGNAAGKPCISVYEEGCRETILPGRTGFFVSPDASSIAEQVKAIDLGTVKRMRKECVSWAMRFDDRVFEQKLRDIIHKHSGISR